MRTRRIKLKIAKCETWREEEAMRIETTTGRKQRRKAPGLFLRGSTWWTKVYVNGQSIRQSTGCRKWEDAKRVLDQRRGRVADGAPVLPRADRVRYEEAAKDLRQWYAVTGKRESAEAEGRLKHLDAFFTGCKLAAITPAEITRYVAKRQSEPTQMIAARDGDTITRRLTSNGTINRELGVLGRMLRLAYKHGKLLRLPIIDKLEEAPARAGFFEREQYEAVRRRLSADLQTACAIAYTFGWRMRSEVLALQRRHLDLGAGTLSLDAGMTKNGEGRVVYLTSDLKTALAAQLARVDALQKKIGRVIPSLFPHMEGRHRGQPRREFRKAWASACAAAGVPGMLKHDLRRTAVRNLERRGVPRSVATKLTGHKTEAVYRRYAIVSDADLREASLRLDGHISGHSAAPALETSAARG